ncbi:hypothetical protein BU26DRAFT_290860 [Trematosphaeria pertusa]|uniref:Uncharacterized protein n=1 Tax=Trematosphaeria pertusa TaxID=390896 RepID=A0A6A6IGX6_9PLEO|nr:uncharacterized protein BU26DRAFT_290860 [Trematosphaeria pertusa]KAF2249844.1 hypothetical protein BU26DRAFT_290860 [Trematosphaeria pertusa]
MRLVAGGAGLRQDGGEGVGVLAAEEPTKRPHAASGLSSLSPESPAIAGHGSGGRGTTAFSLPPRRQSPASLPALARLCAARRSSLPGTISLPRPVSTAAPPPCRRHRVRPPLVAPVAVITSAPRG